MMPRVICSQRRWLRHIRAAMRAAPRTARWIAELALDMVEEEEATGWEGGLALEGDDTVHPRLGVTIRANEGRTRVGRAQCRGIQHEPWRVRVRVECRRAALIPAAAPKQCPECGIAGVEIGCHLQLLRAARTADHRAVVEAWAGKVAHVPIIVWQAASARRAHANQ